MTDRTTWDESIRYVDTHCHVDLFPDPSAVMREAQAARVGVIAVTNTPSVFPAMQRLAAPFPNVIVALGLHPELAAQREAELQLLPQLLREAHFIGEIGLDGTVRDAAAQASQRRVLRAFVESIGSGRPRVLSVHTRRAVPAAFDALADTSGAVILHWFTGTVTQARRAADRGWWFSVNQAMLGGSRARALLRYFPHDAVLTESDGPLSRVDGRSARPVDVVRVVDQLALLWGVAHEDARRRILENLRRCADAGYSSHWIQPRVGD